MPRITEEDLRKFGEENFARYGDLYERLPRDPTDEDFATDGIVVVQGELVTVVNPYYSECARFAVDPIENYGEMLFNHWKAKAIFEIQKRRRAAVIEKMKGKGRAR